MLNYELFIKGAKWDDLTKFTALGDALSPVFCSLPESVTKGLGMLHARTASLGVIALSEDVLSKPSTQLSEPPDSSVLNLFSSLYQPVLGKHGKVVDDEWTAIAPHEIQKPDRNSRSERQENQIIVSERDPRSPIALMHHSGAEIAEEVIKKTVLARSVPLPENLINVSALARKEMYLVWLLREVDFTMLVEKIKFEHRKALPKFVEFLLADPP